MKKVKTATILEKKRALELLENVDFDISSIASQASKRQPQIAAERNSNVDFDAGTDFIYGNCSGICMKFSCLYDSSCPSDIQSCFKDKASILSALYTDIFPNSCLKEPRGISSSVVDSIFLLLFSSDRELISASVDCLLKLSTLPVHCVSILCFYSGLLMTCNWFVSQNFDWWCKGSCFSRGLSLWQCNPILLVNDPVDVIASTTILSPVTSSITTPSVVTGNGTSSLITFGLESSFEVITAVFSRVLSDPQKIR